jgi:hypothetical protein
MDVAVERSIETTRERLVSRVLDATETRRKRHKLDARFCSPWCSDFLSQRWGNRGKSGDISLCLVAQRPKLSNLPVNSLVGASKSNTFAGADDNPLERSGTEGIKYREPYLTQKFGSSESGFATVLPRRLGTVQRHLQNDNRLVSYGIQIRQTPPPFVRSNSIS